MSLSEGERLVRLETKVDSISDQLNKFDEKLDVFIRSADDRYSSKWVEKSVLALFGIVVSSLLGLIVYLLQRHII